LESTDPELNAETISKLTPLVLSEYVFRFSQYAAIVYCEKEDAMAMSNVALELDNPKSAQLLLGSFTIVDWVEVDGLRYNILINEQQNAIIVTFRGTSNMKNWIVDAKFWLIKPDKTLFPNCPPKAEVHSGFHGAMKVIMQNKNSDLGLRLLAHHKAHPKKHIIFVGHSLGGALAVLAAGTVFMTVPDLKSRIRAVYTYGQPLVGNSLFTDWITNELDGRRFVRVVVGDDIVPFMNFNGWDHDLPLQHQVRHSHGGTEIWLKDPSTRTYVICNDGDKEGCALSKGCGKRRWKDHSRIGGPRITGRFCILGKKSDDATR